VEGEDEKARMTSMLQASAFSGFKGKKPKLPLGHTLPLLAKK